MAQLRNDSISEEIKKDAEILYIGNQTFKELKNKETNQSSLEMRSRRIMRTLVIFKKTFNQIYKKKTTNKPLNFSATLQLKYWPIYQETIQKLIYSKKNEEVYFKRGTAINLRHCLSLGIQRMKSFYRRYKTSEDPENAKIIVQNLTEFEDEFKNSKAVDFGPITCVNLTARAKKRAAEFLPNEKDIKNLMEACNKIFAKINKKKIITNNYILKLDKQQC